MTNKLLVLLALMGLFGAACGTGDTDAGTDASGADTEAAAAGETGTDDATAGADGTGDDSAGDGETSDLNDPEDGETAAEGTLGALLFADDSTGATPTTARFEGEVAVDGQPGSGVESGSFTMSGAFDLPNDAMSMTIDFGSMAGAGVGGEAGMPAGFEDFFTEPMEMILIGEQAWMKWGLVSMFTGVEGGWLALEPEEFGTASASFGLSSAASNPAELLTPLTQADGNLEDLGIETVRGVDTRHWRATVDLESLAATASPAERAELEQQYGELGSAQPIDLWIGVDDGYLHRYEVTTVDPTTGASSTIVFEMFDYGEPVDITPPPADQVVDAEGLMAGF